MQKKNIIIGCVVLVLLVLFSVGLYFIVTRNNDENSKKNEDAKKFQEEYTGVSEDNLFVYRTIEENIRIIEKGTGVVYLGFPECPWCQAYVKYLDEAMKEVGISKIYYTNIKQDREDNTEAYQKIIELLGDYVEYNDEGKERIYAPTIIFVNDGKIVGMDSETAKDTKGFKTPGEYWSEEKVKNLKNRLIGYAKQVNESTCSDCNK